MTRSFAPARRLAALSVAITLFAAPLASAQTAEAVPPNPAQPNTALLSPAAFARLVQPTRAQKVSTRVGADSRRPSLLSQAKTAISAQAQGATAKAPQQKSWAARNKANIIGWSVVGVLAFVGVWFLLPYVVPE